jgi:pimeloyl-ACP methyl ester carboxylesterase
LNYVSCAPLVAEHRYKTNVIGLQWAYRQSKPKDKADSKAPVVVLVHGLGSSSWSWRCVLLGTAGQPQTIFLAFTACSGSAERFYNMPEAPSTCSQLGIDGRTLE